MKRTPASCAIAISRCVNRWQSPVSSSGSRRPPTKDSRSGRKRRLCTDAALAIQQLEPDAILAQHRDILADGIELRLLSEQLQRALTAMIVGNAGLGAQLPQTVAAVFGDRHHSRFVDGVAIRRAVAQRLQHPSPHQRIELRMHHQRTMFVEHPLNGLERHAGPGPGRGIAGRNLAGIGKTGFERNARPDDRRSTPRQPALARLIRGGHADHPGAHDQDFHQSRPVLRWRARDGPRDDAAPGCLEPELRRLAAPFGDQWHFIFVHRGAHPSPRHRNDAYVVHDRTDRKYTISRRL